MWGRLRLQVLSFPCGQFAENHRRVFRQHALHEAMIVLSTCGFSVANRPRGQNLTPNRLVWPRP